MKKVLFAISVVAMAILASCTKEDINKVSVPQEGFEVSIIGEMGEFAATKSTGESCIRLKWAAGDVVYAYGSNGSAIVALGKLTVSLENDYAYVALMNGTLTAAPSDGTLYLVHCPLLTAAPAITGGAVSISLAEQPSNCLPVVAYATVTGVSAKGQENLKATFNFASSVIKANVYGIANSTTMFSASLSNVNTACKITFGETVEVAGETVGTIVKCLDASSSATGKADFYIAVPAIDEDSGRILTVRADNWYSKAGAVTQAHGANSYVNTICDLTLTETCLMPGKFTVNASGKQVQFTGGNLYWDGSAFKLEAAQNVYPTSWNTKHVGLLFWTKTTSVSDSYASMYTIKSNSTSDVPYFAESNKNNWTVDGEKGLYALTGGSSGEWNYLFKTRTNASNLYKLDVSVTTSSGTTAKCIVIAPDGYTGTIASSYTAEKWTIAEAVGLVCLPYSGCRTGTMISGGSPRYWSATPDENDEDDAYRLDFYSGTLHSDDSNYRGWGRSVRLVSTVE